MLRAGQRVWRALLTARPFLAAPHGRAWTPAFRVCSSSPSSNASKPSTANAPTDASTDQFHSCFGVVDFLINKIGLNTAAAQRMVTRFPPLLSVDPKSLDHTVNFLKSLGCSAEDMRKVLARCPSLAGQHPRKYDEQIAFLRSFGLTRENIRKVVVQMPQVLQLRQDTLRSRLRYLNQTLGLPREKICRVITKHPQVMQLSVAESLDSRAQSLAELLDMDVLDVGRLVYRHPQVLSSNLEVLAQRVDFYRDLGIDVRRLFSRCPQVLNLRIDEHVAPRIEQIRDKFGLPTDRTARLILQMPQVLTLSWDTINIRIDFLKIMFIAKPSWIAGDLQRSVSSVCESAHKALGDEVQSLYAKI